MRLTHYLDRVEGDYSVCVNCNTVGYDLDAICLTSRERTLMDTADHLLRALYGLVTRDDALAHNDHPAQIAVHTALEEVLTLLVPASTARYLIHRWSECMEGVEFLLTEHLEQRDREVREILSGIYG